MLRENEEDLNSRKIHYRDLKHFQRYQFSFKLVYIFNIIPVEYFFSSRKWHTHFKIHTEKSKRPRLAKVNIKKNETGEAYFKYQDS